VKKRILILTLIITLIMISSFASLTESSVQDISKASTLTVQMRTTAQNFLVYGSTTDSGFSLKVAIDGTGDFNCDGVADNVEINAALQAIKARGGGSLELRPGTYNLAGPVRVSSQTTIVGSGLATVLRFQGAKGFNHLIENENYDNSSARDNNILLTDFVIDGNRGQTGTAGIGFRNVDHVSLINLRVFNCHGDGVVFNPSTAGGGKATDVSFSNVQVTGCGADGFAFKGMTRLSVQNVLLRSNGDRAGGSGITILTGPNINDEYNNYLFFENVTADYNQKSGVSMKASYHVTWRDSSFTNSKEEDGFISSSTLSKTTILTSQDSFAASGYVDFINCKASKNAGWGFHLTGGGIHDLHFTNSAAYENGRDGFLIYNTGQNIVLTNSSAWHNGWNGVYFLGETLKANATIAGGMFYDNSLQTPQKYNGICLQNWSNSTVTGVKAFDDQNPKTQRWGIVSTYGDYNAFVGNDLRGNAAGPILTKGPHDKVQSNLG